VRIARGIEQGIVDLDSQEHQRRIVDALLQGIDVETIGAGRERRVNLTFRWLAQERHGLADPVEVMSQRVDDETEPEPGVKMARLSAALREQTIVEAPGEELRDPNHASLLQVFLVTVGLFRADNPSKLQVDKTGRHGALLSWRGEQERTADNAEMKSLLEHFTLQDPTMLQPVREFPEYTVVMTTLGLISSFSSNRTPWRCAS
jgi:hypothetical protein